MKKWKCDFCKRETETNDEIILIQCKCSSPMHIVGGEKDKKIVISGTVADVQAILERVSLENPGMTLAEYITKYGKRGELGLC